MMPILSALCLFFALAIYGSIYTIAKKPKKEIIYIAYINSICAFGIASIITKLLKSDLTSAFLVTGLALNMFLFGLFLINKNEFRRKIKSR